MKLSSVLKKDLVFLDANLANFAEIINFISEKFSLATGKPTVEIQKALFDHEKIGMTFLGHRLALPHAYVDGLNDIYVLYVRLGKEIAVKTSIRDEKIKHVFSILAPRQKSKQYLLTLQAVAMLVKENILILENAASALHLLDTLDNYSGGIANGRLVRDFITSKISVGPNTPIRDALNIMENEKSTFLPVVSQEGKLVGALSLWDIFKKALLPDTKDLPDDSASFHDLGSLYIKAVKSFFAGDADKRVSEFMDPPDLFMVDENASDVDLIFLMEQRHVRFFVVVGRDHSMLGIVDGYAIAR